MRDIVHIGYPRAASSWFQQFFYQNIQNYTFIQRNTVRKNLIDPLPGFYDSNWNKALKLGDTPHIVSEEMISGKIRAGSINLHFLEIYARRLKESFNNPLIVIFLRRQPDIIFSFYNLYIKKGGTYSFSKFLMQDLSLQESLLFSKTFFCYDLPLQILMKTFGKESVKIYLYEEFETNPEAFIKRFCNDLKLKVDINNISSKRINSSYSSFQRKVKQLLNMFTGQGIPFKHYFLNLPFVYDLLQKGNRKQSKIPGSIFKQIDNFYPEFARSNNRLIKDYNLSDIKKYNYPL